MAYVATTSRLRDAVQDAVVAFGAPGVQVAWLSDGCVEQVEVGTLRVGGTDPVTADSRFPLASVTKVVTATLAMQLVADGELDVDEPIAPFLPAGEVRQRLGGLTLGQLLSHTSGLENEPGDDVTALDSTLTGVRALAREPLLFPPGEQFSYANAGYVVAGHVVEAVTGLSWADGVRSFLLEPLGVRATFTQSGAAGDGAPVTGHLRRHDGRVVPVDAPRRGRGWAPASGLAVSASGLIGLMALHLTGGRAPEGYALLPPPLVAGMRSRRVRVPNPGFADAWGLGFGLNPDRSGTDWFGHDGEGRGTSVYVRACADRGFAVAMVANCLPAREEWRHLLRALAAAGVDVGDAGLPPMPSRPQPIDPAAAGVYEYRAGRLTVTREGGGLLLETSAHDRLTLRPVGGDRCLAVREGDGGDPFLVAFLRDEAGCVRYLHVGGRVARRVAG